MAKSTPNERIKRAYIDFLRQAMGRSEVSRKTVAARVSDKTRLKPPRMPRRALLWRIASRERSKGRLNPTI